MLSAESRTFHLAYNDYWATGGWTILTENLNRTFMARLTQVVLIATTIALSWLMMMVVHESGHVFVAWLTGGKVAHVLLLPLSLSRTDLIHNPCPVLVAWGGPVVGVLLPVIAFAVAVLVKMPMLYLLHFFAGFCLVANGVYIGAGSFADIGDAFDLLHGGAPHWHLIAFGAITIPIGLFLWNGLGVSFGLGKAKGKIDPRAAYVASGLLMLVVLVELILS